MSSRSKKLPTPDAPPAWLVAAAWIGRLRFIPAIALGGIGLVMLAAWLDPERAARGARELAAAKARLALQEARLLAQVRAEPATGRLNLSFQKLSFALPETNLPRFDDTGVAPYLPTGIKQYDGRDVRIHGYMLPTKIEGGAVKECLILANPLACCFGQSPRFCEFIAARFGGTGVPELMDEPLCFEGKLRVGDVFADRTWVALYAMDCSAVNRAQPE